ncbi:hypothetical protein DPMN_181327 [Dreissena polymorpha]|uniref:Uncharacterized protein n=1 Tax=Dreissena polymorpha TaxID=45954 RepID=A0A9D4DCM8_DREPO|nr:hypothetical protein DPMN_181327 [Dreissena polymorpha]
MSQSDNHCGHHGHSYSDLSDNDTIFFQGCFQEPDACHFVQLLVFQVDVCTGVGSAVNVDVAADSAVKDLLNCAPSSSESSLLFIQQFSRPRLDLNRLRVLRR